MERGPRVASMWAGHVGDEDAAFAHVEFNYADDRASSTFVREQGLDWIDEDFAELNWSPSGTPDLAECSYGETFAPTAQPALDAIPDADTAYLVYDVDASALVHPSDALLTYVGTYPVPRRMTGALDPVGWGARVN